VTEPISVDIDDAAAMVGVSARTLDRAIKAGALKAKRTGKRGGLRLISVAALREWFDQLEDV
jgi:excisionase family DNA binding protein